MRKNTLEKTTKPNIYKITSMNDRVEYIVRFSFLNKNYGQRNFTKLFGCSTLNQTVEMFNSVKVELSRGNNPFKKKVSISLDTLWEERKTHIKAGSHLYILEKFYLLHIQSIIGKKDIDEIEEKHIYKILNGTLRESGSSNRMKLRTILNPIFKKAIKKEQLKISPLEYIKFEKPQNREGLSSILVNDFTVVAKKIYKEIMKVEDKQDRLSFLLGFMTARRRGELLQYKHSDIKDDKLFVPKEIIKMSKADQFPLPKEALDIIQTLPKEERDNLFTIPVGRVTKRFTLLIENSNIELTKDETFTFHQCRHLFQSIMIPETNNPPLVDRCLSHTQNSVMSVYLSFEYKNRKKVFEKYWEIIRG